jgi:alkyl hydroperoxide reductase subunit AhpC
MATLILASQRAVSGDQSVPNLMRLHEWLNGHWGILYSNPEDFAPHPSTPRGFIARLCGEFEQYDVKPITLGNEIGAAPQSWLDVAVDDNSLVIVDANGVDEPVVDLAERALAMRLAKLEGPFVMILDAHGRCRSTISYRPRRIDRPRTLADILNVVEVLRGGARSLARAV